MTSPDLIERLAAARKELERKLGRLRRNLLRAQDDLARIDRVPELLADAELLKTVAAKVRPYDETIEVDDYSTGSKVRRSLSLTPGKSVALQLEQRFALAKRLGRARGSVQSRLATLRAQVAAVEKSINELANFEGEQASEPAAEEWLEQNEPPPTAQLGKPTRGGERHDAIPHRTYRASSGREIWVGKGARQNDQLTFRVASPHASWLHASGWAGAHVVVPKNKGETLDPTTRAEAALLAAHFSQAPKDDWCEVLLSEVKFVRKPKRVAAGLVSVTREERLRVLNDPRAAKRLIAPQS